MKICVIGDFHGKFPKKLEKIARRKDIDLVVSVGDHTGISEWKPIFVARLKAARKGEKVPTPEEIIGKKRFKELLKKDFNSGKFILKEINSLGKKVFLIFGNSDDEWYKYPFDDEINSQKKRVRNIIKKLNNIKIITYGSSKLNGINFVGFGGYMDIDAFFNKETFKNDKISFRIKRRNKSKKKLWSILKQTKSPIIFVFHYPPRRAFDTIKDIKENPMNGKSAGVSFFTEAIKKYKPLLTICGHMHEYQGVKKLYGVPVINPGAAYAGKAAIINIDDKTRKVKSVKFLK